MSTDPNTAKPPVSTPAVNRDKGVKIFMYPKVIYLFPTLVVSLICWLGMLVYVGRLADPSKAAVALAAQEAPAINISEGPPANAPITRTQRFSRIENLFGVLFLTVFAFNLIVMALDFPRFTVLGVALGILFVIFFFLWVGAFYELNLMRPIEFVISRIYAAAYPGFYLAFFLITSLVFLIIYATRWLDYWEILPNEILHHHGPLSDLERFPTMNLKFDKEIPDVFEFMLLGAGKLVLHVPNVERSIVLENVLFINSKEEALKRLMSRLEVRVTTDREADAV